MFGLPTLVLEGMTHGKPIVAPDEPGCMEAIAGGEFGLYYQLGDIDELTAKTRAAISGTDKSCLCREFVLKEYDWRVVAPKLDAFYFPEGLV